MQKSVRALLVLSLSLWAVSAPASNLTIPKFRAQTITGAAIPSAKLYFYLPTTTTPKDTYSDSALTVPNANPVVADGNGWFGEIWLTAAEYKIVMKDAAGATVWTCDHYYPASSALNNQITASSSTATAALTATNSSSGSAIVATNSGSGYGITSTGAGSGYGVYTTGGAGGGIGLQARGGATNGKGARIYGGASDGDGLYVAGDGTGYGIQALGGHTSGIGGDFYGGATNGTAGKFTAGSGNGTGVISVGTGTGQGGTFTGGPTSGTGITATGGEPSGTGGIFSGGTTNGDGISSTAYGNGAAVYAESSTGSGYAVKALAQETGIAIKATATDGYALYVDGDTTSPIKPLLHLTPQNSYPSGAVVVGDIYVTTAGVLKICTVAGTGAGATWTTVGVQTP